MRDSADGDAVVVGHLQDHQGQAPRTQWSSLTGVERQVAALVAEHMTNAEIGERLFLAAGTVKNHLSLIFSKLGISRRRELARE